MDWNSIVQFLQVVWIPAMPFSLVSCCKHGGRISCQCPSVSRICRQGLTVVFRNVPKPTDRLVVGFGILVDGAGERVRDMHVAAPGVHHNPVWRGQVIHKCILGLVWLVTIKDKRRVSTSGGAQLYVRVGPRPVRRHPPRPKIASLGTKTHEGA